MASIEDNILSAINTVVSNSVNNLQFDKTVRATVKELVDAGIGEYRVQYQNSVLTAYANNDSRYAKGDQVYVRMPSNPDMVSEIIGKVAKIGTQYLEVVKDIDKMTRVGSNCILNAAPIELCSYRPESRSLYGQAAAAVQLDTDNIRINATKVKHIILSYKARTNLPIEQQSGGGNYGITVTIRYYDPQYTTHTTAHTVDRTYTLDVNNMQGQPYKFELDTQQNAIFEIDGTNFYKIVSIDAFCKKFPHEANGKPSDIFLSNLSLYFAEPLSETELSSESLKIIFPNGNYITSDNNDTRFLEAELKIRGKKINLKREKVSFYWFIKDTSVNEDNGEYYCSYGGNGWRCLNSNANKYTQGGKTTTVWVADDYRYEIKPTLVPADISTFKCVAVYENVILSATADFYHAANYQGNNITLTSDVGNKFYFGTGKATITCSVNGNAASQLGYTYYWGYRTQEGGLNSIAALEGSPNEVVAKINEAVNTAIYECTVYNGKQFVGSGYITLTNGSTENIRVIIKDSTRVFKYNEEGKSPYNEINDVTESHKTGMDRSQLQLTFDVINAQGQSLIPTGTEADLINMFQPVWVLPDDDYSLLEFNDSNLDIVDETVTVPTTNLPYKRRVVKNAAGIAFELRNYYDTDRTDNNIRLEISYGGQIYSTTTNFIILKEGQSGTNGTKYIAKIEPGYDNKGSRIDQIIVENGQLVGYNKTTEYFYDKVHGDNGKKETFHFANWVAANILQFRFINGSEGILFLSGAGGFTNNLGPNTALTWKMLSLPQDTSDTANYPFNVTLNSNGTIYGRYGLSTRASIIQAELKTDFNGVYKGGQQRFYATYPIDAYASNDGSRFIVDGGYRECMYEADGTRSNFNGKPFILRRFVKDGNGNWTEQTVNPAAVTWIPHWCKDNDKELNAYKNKNEIRIEPPAIYDSTSIDNYIEVKYNGNTVAILTIYFYLNRFGMTAINGWDGTSIDINKDKGYILAPQIGAGVKDDNNGFTGVVMGKSMYSDSNVAMHEQVGLMGFNQGTQSFFLDAQTGRAIFGSSGHGQIAIDPATARSNSRVPAGSIYSWNYFTHDSYGRPQYYNKQGMLIDLETPQIRFGSGDFVINKYGHLTAKGGGYIGGWHIDNTKLWTGRTKDNPTITLESGAKYNATDGSYDYTDVTGYIYTNQHDAIDSPQKGFFLSKDGMSIGSKVRIDSDGVMKLGSGAVNDSSSRHWTVNGSTESYISYNDSIFGEIDFSADNPDYWSINKVNSSSVYIGTDGIRLGTKFAVDRQGNLYAKDGKFKGRIESRQGHIGGWTITSNSIHSNYAWLYSNGSLIFGSTSDPHFKIDTSGNIYAINGYFQGRLETQQGYIGKWTINEASITSNNGNTRLGADGTLTVGSQFFVDSTGKLTATGGDFSGKITAGEGKIGGWTIGENKLSAVNGSVTLDSTDGSYNAGSNGVHIGALGAGGGGGYIILGGDNPSSGTVSAAFHASSNGNLWLGGNLRVGASGSHSTADGGSCAVGIGISQGAEWYFDNNGNIKGHHITLADTQNPINLSGTTFDELIKDKINESLQGTGYSSISKLAETVSENKQDITTLKQDIQTLASRVAALEAKK